MGRVQAATASAFSIRVSNFCSLNIAAVFLVPLGHVIVRLGCFCHPLYRWSVGRLPETAEATTGSLSGHFIGTLGSYSVCFRPAGH